jgi:hypothetical protein
MNMKELERYIATQCVYETIYQDSEGREILVMRVLDALGMVNTLLEAEREACAKFAAEYMEKHEGAHFGIADAIRARGQA